MIRWASVLLTCVAWSLGTAALAQLAMAAEPVAARVQAGPGTAVTLRLRIDNPAERPAVASMRVSMPAGWALLIPPGDVPLAAQERRVVVFSVRIPSSAQAGAHPVTVELEPQGEGPAQHVGFEVVVPVVEEGSLLALRAPEYVTSERFTSTFLLRNDGNAATAWKLSARSSQDLPLSIEPAQVRLEAGASIEVRVEATVPADLSASAAHVLTLHAEHASDSDQRTVARARSTLVPRAPSASPLHHTFPLTVRFEAGGRHGRQSSLTMPSVDVHGAGPLSASDPGRLTLRLKTSLAAPLVPEQALVAYSGADGRLAAGRQQFTRSPLLGNENGFGVSAIRRWKSAPGLTLTGEGNAYLGASGLAGTVQALADLEGGVRASGMLHASSDDILGSLHGGYQNPVANPRGLELARLQATYAVRLARTLPAADHALRLRGGLRDGASNLSARYDLRTSGFEKAGARRALEVRAALRLNQYLPLDPAGPVDVHLSYGREQWAPDPGEPTAKERHEHSFGATLTIRLAPVTVSLGHAEDRGRVGSTTEATARTHAQAHIPLGLHSSLRQRLTWTRNGSSLPGRLQYEAEGTIPTGEIGSLHVDVDVEAELAAPRLEALSVGAQWSGTPTPTLFLRGKATAQLIGSDELGALGLDARHSFSNGHQLDVEIDATLPRNGSPAVIAGLGYALPVGVPLGRRNDVGTLRGHVRDAQGKGLAGVIVTAAGLVAATSEDGSYLMPGLPAGEHRVHLVPSTVPVADPILEPSTPALVEIRGAETVQLAFQVTPGATIIGSLIPQDASEEATGAVGPDSEAQHWLQGATVEASDGTTTIRATTDASGAFRLTSLPPGTWTLRVRNPRLPPDFRIEPDERELRLAVGERQTAEFRLTPIHRAIRFQEGGPLGNGADD